MQAPKANAYCERLIGTVRRECLDYVIPIDEWAESFATGWRITTEDDHTLAWARVFPTLAARLQQEKYRHHLEPWEQVTSTSGLGGLHHEYQIKHSAA